MQEPEKLVTIREYIADKPNLTYNMVRRWLTSGMKHVNGRPILFKSSWVEEFLEKTSQHQEPICMVVSTNSGIKIPKKKARMGVIKQNCDMKLRYEDFIK